VQHFAIFIAGFVRLFDGCSELTLGLGLGLGLGSDFEVKLPVLALTQKAWLQ
jgi:hypothetical protein